MADNFYTTQDLRRILGIDRTTVYRLADAGRLPGVKIGRQWRFPHRLIDQWLADMGRRPASSTLAVHEETILLAPVPAPPLTNAGGTVNLTQVLPVECVQLMQDSFADALGVTILMTDLHGRPVTHISNPCGFHRAVEADPRAHARCQEWWAEQSQRLPLQVEFIESPMGLLCARALFRAGSEIVGSVIFTGLAPEPWPPADAALASIAERLEMDTEPLAARVHQVFRAGQPRRQELAVFAQRLADIVTHILTERRRHRTTLAHIAALTES